MTQDSTELCERLEAFEGSDDLGNGDFTVCCEAAARIRALEAALRPFAAMRQSTEGEVSDCLWRSPAEEMRISAGRIEKRDADIRAARAALTGGD